VLIQREGREVLSGVMSAWAYTVSACKGEQKRDRRRRREWSVSWRDKGPWLVGGEGRRASSS
jgi:hypothetical protein